MKQEQKAANPERNHAIVNQVCQTLDAKYNLSRKIDQEPQTDESIVTFFRRLGDAFGDLSTIKGKRILDLGCGSSTSRHPWTGQVTPMFEPWLCRILLALGATPVGVDMLDLSDEDFEHHRVNLGELGALDFLPPTSFDAVHDHRIFGSPEFTSQYPTREDYLRIAGEINAQERRVLKPGGIIIHTDIS